MLEVNDITWYRVTWCFMYHMGSNGSISRDVCTGSLQIRFVSTILPPFIFNGMFYNRINNEKARIKSDTIWLRRFSTHFELFWAMKHAFLKQNYHFRSKITINDFVMIIFMIQRKSCFYDKLWIIKNYICIIKTIRRKHVFQLTKWYKWIIWNYISSNEHLVLDSSFFCYLFYKTNALQWSKITITQLNQENRFPDWAMAIRTGPLGWTIDSG